MVPLQLRLFLHCVNESQGLTMDGYNLVLKWSLSPKEI